MIHDIRPYRESRGGRLQASSYSMAAGATFLPGEPAAFNGLGFIEEATTDPPGIAGITAESAIDIERKKISITNSSLDGLTGATGQKILCIDTVGTGEAGDCGSSCDATADVSATEAYLPVLRNNRENGAPALEQPWPVIDGTPATLAGDCDEIARLGSVVRLVTDTAAGACTDAGADGILDGGGTAVSVCKCLASTAWGAL